MKGNEKDCICEKPKGKHREYCDAYRLAEFHKKMTKIQKRNKRNILSLYFKR